MDSPLPENPGKKIWEVFPYFDKEPPFSIINPMEKNDRYMGGVRKRLFKLRVNLRKVPLIKYGAQAKLDAIHRVLGVALSCIQGALLHFKYDASFVKRAMEEARREEHWSQALEYKRYLQVISENKDFTFYDAGSL